MLGKIIGGLIGWFSLGPVGAVIGLFAGHFFDRGRSSFARRFSPEQRQQVENAFFTTVFPLMGFIAKSDGRVSEDEIAGTEQLMSKMGLSSEARKSAIALFQSGTAAEFSLDEAVHAFVRVCGQYADLKQILLVYLITLAYADGHLHEAEERVLARIANDLGYSKYAFNHLMGMVKAQSYFYRGGQGGGSSDYSSSHDAPSAGAIEKAYQALGQDASVSDIELKRAYRRLMSQHHPDKLAGRGVPDDMIKMATERSQEIQTAYELIKNHRKPKA